MSEYGFFDPVRLFTLVVAIPDRSRVDNEEAKTIKSRRKLRRRGRLFLSDNGVGLLPPR